MKVIFGMLKYFFIVAVAGSLVAAVVGGLVFLHYSSDLPNIITVEDYKPLGVTKIIGKGGDIVAEYFEERRYLLQEQDIPNLVARAFVSAEDDRFFEHQGIDFQGITRAAIANFKAGRVVQGGSTITQQVAKSLLLTPERSFFRKMKEVILASRMERNLSKQQILYLYLNQIYLGSGSYGIEAAARTYFGKSAKELELAEAAILGGLPQAPSKYSPLISPKMAKQRQLYVLRRMMEDGVISQADMEKAVSHPVRIHIAQDPNLEVAPYYAEHIRKHLLEKYGKTALYHEGMTVYTPIDTRLARVATKAMQEGLRAVDKRHGYRGPIKKTKKSEEEDALAEVFEYNAVKAEQAKILTADGNLTVNPDVLLKEGDIYKAIVTVVEDSKKQVQVNLGNVQGIIPLEKMNWAYPQKANNLNPEIIAYPSRALSKGDVIWVRYVSKAPDSNTLICALEQSPAVQGALVSVDVASGEVVSMVGGYSFTESEFNRAIQAERQPGSAYKPVIYAAAVDKGYTPVTIIQDSPIVFDKGENEKWKPENYEEKFYGDTLFRSALIHSRNIPTIKIVQDIQIPYLIEYSKRLGLPNKFNADLSISLGSNTIAPLDLISVYAVFPRGGRRMKPIFYNKVVDREGKVLEESAPTPNAATSSPLKGAPRSVSVAGELATRAANNMLDPGFGEWTADAGDPDRVMDPRTAYVLTHLMNEVTLYGTAHDVKSLGRPAAGKTGTTNDYLDAWFIGFTPQIVTGVWVGFDTQKSLGPRSAGASVALPIWLDYMKEAVKDTPIVEFAVPKGVAFSYVNTASGKPVGPASPNSVKEAFIEGTEPGSAVQASYSSGGSTNSTGSAGAGSQPGQMRPSPPRESGAQGDFFKEDIE